MKDKKFGTVFGPGSPPEEISGFYHLTEAPWTIVIMARGEKSCSLLSGSRFFIFLHLPFVSLYSYFYQTVNKQSNYQNQGVSAAADDLAKGKFGSPLPVKTLDEVGELRKVLIKCPESAQTSVCHERWYQCGQRGQQNSSERQNFS